MDNEPTIKLAVTLGIGLANAERSDVIDTGIPVSEWNALTSEQQEERVHEEWKEWIWEYVDGGGSVVDE
ncbi:hypothetical protein FH608_046325 [Nonomuraea phyllanthi]|uniref:DUF7167 domain-containing protein n=1 Tax=Nonomuraea phyllanthi TaxID=2219224 RepID=A0A5C4V5T4_9ACTN|nr:hypothetical protein [Nonomuraea phyllanthi]KAB8186911.1 hypothetical protein FH608_046325 [Nonomuraea phyllanthi]